MPVCWYVVYVTYRIMITFRESYACGAYVINAALNAGSDIMRNKFAGIQ